MVPTGSPGKLHELQNQLVGLGGLVALAAGTGVEAGLAVKKARSAACADPCPASQWAKGGWVVAAS